MRLVPGYFVDSLPGLRTALKGRGETLAILRMDGDMYDSTMDILYNLYDLVSVGGVSRGGTTIYAALRIFCGTW